MSAPHKPTLLRRLRAGWHRVMGWAWYRLGALELARREFERVLRCLDGDDFSAYVGLGRVAYRLGDYVAWKRECSLAQRTSPQRYAKLRQPFELFEPRPDGDLGDRLAEAAMGWDRPSLAPAASDLTAAVGAGGAEVLRGTSMRCDDGATHAVRGDDFVDDAERARFAGRPPISGNDVSAVDLDDLASRLTG
ncbi:MAG: hypothetical protein AB7I19_15870 [Planctomycetota bacterium]